MTKKLTGTYEGKTTGGLLKFKTSGIDEVEGYDLIVDHASVLCQLEDKAVAGRVICGWYFNDGTTKLAVEPRAKVQKAAAYVEKASSFDLVIEQVVTPSLDRFRRGWQ